MTLARDLRLHVADLLDQTGPDAPTLCDGWTTRDLAHLVIRDRRPDALPGIGVERFAGHTRKVQDAQAARPYPETVDLVRSGPPWYSVAAIPAIDGRMNLAEYAIHAEDIRRAGSDDRALPVMPNAGQVSDAVWSMLPLMARIVFRKAPVGIVARDAGRDDITLKKPGKAGTVVLEGRPLEVLLLASGRGEHAKVSVQGAPEAVEAFTAWTDALGL